MPVAMVGWEAMARLGGPATEFESLQEQREHFKSDLIASR
jgi:hypothetical protein